MQAIAETVFDTIYLTLVITVGIQMILKSHGNKQYKLFGIMAVYWAITSGFSQTRIE